MRLPQVNATNKAKAFIQEFLGYNHNLRTQSGEFYDMQNISLDNYPVISTRHGEADRLALSGNPNGLHEYKQDTLMAVCGDVLYVDITADNDGRIVQNSPQLLEDSEKSFATIGAYTVIMPDKVIFNAESGELYPIVQRFTSQSFDDECYLIMRTIPCDIEGITVDYVESAEAPEDTSKWWYDTTNKVWKKYSTSSEMWMQIESTFTKLLPAISTSQTSYIQPASIPTAAQDALDALSAYFGSFLALDTVSFSITADGEKYIDHVIQGVGEEGEEGAKVHYIVVVSTDRAAVTEFMVTNRCPDLDHLVSLNNRVWGVSKANNELFACKLGNPTQWYNFAGIASDSYAVTLGFKDEVTASIAYNNYVHFFTEDKIIKIYGDYPENYQLHTYKADGVISGGHDTLVQVEGVLFWVSPIGVVAYDGSLPYFRGQKFSPHFLAGKTCVAGRDGTKYCLSVSEDGEPLGVYTFDVLKGLWAVGGDQLYAKTAEMNNALCILNTESRIITHYDRERTNDWVVVKGENVVTMDRIAADY